MPWLKIEMHSNFAMVAFKMLPFSIIQNATPKLALDKFKMLHKFKMLYKAQNSKCYPIQNVTYVNNTKCYAKKVSLDKFKMLYNLKCRTS